MVVKGVLGKIPHHLKPLKGYPKLQTPQGLLGDVQVRFPNSHEQCSRAPGWLFDVGDYTTQLYGHYNKPIQGSL